MHVNVAVARAENMVAKLAGEGEKVKLAAKIAVGAEVQDALVIVSGLRHEEVMCRHGATWAKKRGALQMRQRSVRQAAKK